MLQGLNVGKSDPTNTDICWVVCLFFSPPFKSISVIAEPDCLQGPASRPQRVGLEPQGS